MQMFGFGPIPGGIRRPRTNDQTDNFHKGRVTKIALPMPAMDISLAHAVISIPYQHHLTGREAGDTTE